MSLSELQKATAALIRFPEQGRQAMFEDFSAEFDLEKSEREQLLCLSKNHQLIRFGKKLRGFRFGDTADELQVLENVLGKDLFEILWFDHFEPQAAHVDTEDLTSSFVQFIANDKASQLKIADSKAEYTRDLVDFLALESSMVHQSEKWTEQSIPENTELKSMNFEIIQLNYDIPQFLETLHSQEFDVTKIRENPPNQIALSYLRHPGDLPEIYKITRDVSSFLSAQKQGVDAAKPQHKYYKELVKVGICK